MDTIIHSGIKGQKWGVRRYQNEDGTLTEAGRARYYKDSEGKFHRKKAINMSTRDLDKSNARLKAENTYTELSGNKVTKAMIRAGVTASASFVAGFGAMAIKDMLKEKTISIGKDSIKKDIFVGLLSAGIGAITSLAKSAGGDTNTNLGPKDDFLNKKDN